MDISREAIQNKKFDVARKGYDQSQVDAFLEEIILALNKAQKEADADKFELAKYRELEYTLTNTLITAQQTAQNLTHDAQTEADKIRSDARSEAEFLIADATSNAEQMKKTAESEVASMRAEAEAEISTIRNRLYAMRDFEQKYRAELRNVVQKQMDSLNARFPSEDEWDASPVAHDLDESAKQDGKVDLTDVLSAPQLEDADLKALIDELS